METKLLQLGQEKKAHTHINYTHIRTHARTHTNQQTKQTAKKEKKCGLGLNPLHDINQRKIIFNSSLTIPATTELSSSLQFYATNNTIKPILFSTQ